MKLLESAMHFSLGIFKEQRIEVLSLFCIICLVIIIIVLIVLLRKKQETILSILKDNLPTRDFDEDTIRKAFFYYEKQELIQKLDFTVTNVIGMKFMPIPPGTFIMGSPENEQGRDDDEIEHRVTINKGFYMGVTPVTQGQWKAIFGHNPSHFKDCGDDYPVENISWFEAKDFIEKLNQMEQTDRYRLPKEQEWEYACRSNIFSAFGIKTENLSYDEIMNKLGWFSKNSNGITHPVGQKMANPWGLYDMHGNVWEWCEDLYGQYSNNKDSDENSTEADSKRIQRGGSWSDKSSNCRSATRNWLDADNRAKYIGFRVARDSDPC